MTYEETAAGQAIGRLPSEHPGVDPSADGSLEIWRGTFTRNPR